jgi:hypothetical protein
MIAAVCMALLALAFVVWRERRWWCYTTLGSESTATCLYPWYGDNILHYFKTITAPLSSYIFSVTLRRSIPKARRLYTVVLASQGIFLFVATSVLFDSTWAGLVTGACFLLCTFIPQTFDLDMQPEAYGYFFATLGIMLTTLGVHYTLPWLVYLGVSCGSFCFYCKITLLDGLMTLAVIYCFHGVDDMFWTSCLIYAGSTLLFFLLVVVASMIKHKNDDSAFLGNNLIGKLKSIFRMITGELGMRYAKEEKKPIRKYLDFYLGYHSQVVWPLVIMLAACGYQGLLNDKQMTFLVILIAIPLFQCFLRLNYTPLYAFMVHFPLSIAAGVFVTTNAELMIQHPLITLFVLMVAVYAISQILKQRSFVSRYKAKTKVIKEHVLDPIRSDVAPSDFIFQDSWMAFVYLELGCKSPNQSFIWADRIEFVLKEQKNIDCLVDYFTLCKPKYFIVHQKKFNLDYIEHITGLRYELGNTKYAFVYKLASVKEPSGEMAKYDPLFQDAQDRYEKDESRKREQSNSTQ